MPSSGYTADSFTANEQPTTAKFNELWTNDASFNTANGLNDAVIVNRHIAAGAVTGSQLANSTVTATQIANNTITAGQIANNTVTAGQMGAVKLFGVTAAVAGSAPGTTSGNFQIQSGTTVVALSGAGGGVVTFPTAFSSGVLSVIVCNGDNGTLVQPSVINGQVSTTGFGFQYNLTGGNVRVNWMAIGF